MGWGYNQNDYKQLLPSFVMAEVRKLHDIEGIKMGDFVVTNLINTVMPFIRFDLGDCVGILEDADFPTKRIGKVYGRCDDILNVNGQVIFFHRVYQLFTDFVKVKQYKLYQYKSGELEFQIVLKENTSAVEAIQEAQERWTRRYANVPLKIVVKTELPINPKTGKFKVIEKER